MVRSRESLGSTRLVLVSADRGGLRDALAFMLEAEGYAVTVLPTAEAVLALEGAERPACVIVDDATEAPALATVGRLRHAGFLAATMILTGRPSRALAATAALLGAQVIEKPLTPATLLAALESALAD